MCAIYAAYELTVAVEGASDSLKLKGLIMAHIILVYAVGALGQMLALFVYMFRRQRILQ